MTKRLKYIKRAGQSVVAIQLALETGGFTYQKWGGSQRCKAGDWIVNNGGDIYTVDEDTFARTYRATGPGTYAKTTPVWAEMAVTAGEVQTKEGVTHYQAGDYIVYNEAHGGDGYAVARDEFERMYKQAN